MSFLDQFRMLTFGWRDALEILIIAYVLYRLLLLIHGTRAVQMLMGVAMLVAGYTLSVILKLTTVTYLLGLVFTYGALAALIVLQPELRAALAHMGQSRVTRFFRRFETVEVAHEIAEAADQLSRANIGAIIAIERERSLADFVRSGRAMQARVSADLLRSIFTPHAPLHDGAVIIRGDTIIGAGCILPLSLRAHADRTLGTRHLAALGLTEQSDALVIAVSEETGTISLVEGGKLTRVVNAADLRAHIAGESTGEFSARALAERPS